MGVPRHYIKLIGNLQEYATQVDPSVPNWQEAVFNDVTEGGTRNSSLSAFNPMREVYA